MAALFGLFAGGGDRAAKPQYTIESLQHLYNRLRLIPQDADEQNSLAMVEVIRQITEALIWGEQNNHDHNFFDFFCEKNILAEFVRVLGLPHVNRTVKVQLLQTLSMLVQNICRDTSLYYLFSNNYVNHLISTQFDWNDEEILGYYISFLKSLALRLNLDTIQFFFIERSEQFPLYVEAVRFFGHQDQMVRTAIRTLTLQVFRLEDPAMQKFVVERSKRTYFVHLACYLRELWAQLDKAARDAAGSGEQSAAALQDVVEQQQDILMFLSDVLELKSSSLREALAERLLRYALLPVLMGSLQRGFGGADAGADGANGVAAAGLVSPSCALFVLHQVFDIFRSPSLLEPLATALLRLRADAELLRCCSSPPPACPATYRATSEYISGPASLESFPPPPPPPLPPGAEDRGPGDELEAEAPGQAGGDATPSMKGGAVAENLVRAAFFAGLAAAGDDACVLLIAGTLNAILASQQSLPQELLEEAGLVPAPQPRADANEVLLLTVQALGRHVSLRVVVVQVLARFAVTLARESVPPACHEAWRAAPLEAAQSAVRSAARHVRSYLASAIDEAFLDIFAEEWEQDGGPQVDIREASSNIRCLIPAFTGVGSGVPESWSTPAPHAERQHAAKAVRCLLVLRRLQQELEARASDTPEATSTAGTAQGYGGGPAVPAMPSPPPPPPAGIPSPPAEEEWLLRMEEEVKDSYEESRSFELGRQDRIVCGVVTQEGRHTRYLMLHPFLLLLVQPDLMSPGLAVVRTLCPVRQVEPMIAGDPRTLRLVLRLPKGAQCPGEATVYDPSSADGGVRIPSEEHRGSSFFMLTLSFEDVKRCLCADQHIRRRRQDVRAELRGRVEAFIERLSA